MSMPILYSFRRCPYAMRARLAIYASGRTVDLREVSLRDKVPEFLETSPSGTVPCLRLGDDVIDESLDIMLWALEKADPHGWLQDKPASLDLIAQCDGTFKTALDRYKYDARYGSDRVAERARAADFLLHLNERLEKGSLLGSDPKLADFAILPFVRQFANVDRDWFDAQPWPRLSLWLTGFTTSGQFAEIMQKYPIWRPGDPVTLFGHMQQSETA